MNKPLIIGLIAAFLIGTFLVIRLVAPTDPIDREVPEAAPASLSPPSEADSPMVSTPTTLIPQAATPQTAMLDYVALTESPNPDVTIGSDGWLFLTRSLDQSCIDDALLSDLQSTIRTSQAIAAATGRRLVFAIAPDKASIYAANVLDQSQAECVVSTSRAIADWASSAQVDDVVTAWAEMKMSAETDLMFFPHDTHWTSRGSLVLAEQLVERLLPGAWDARAVVLGPETEHEGDLTVMIGLPGSILSEQYLIRRENTESAPAEHMHLSDELSAIRYVSSSDEGLVTGNSLFVHDSFGWSLHDQLAPFFQSAHFLRTSTVDNIHMRDLVLESEIIIFETVARGLVYHTIGQGLDGQLVVALRSELPRHEVAWSLSGNTFNVEWQTDTTAYLVLEAVVPHGSEVLVWHSGSNPNRHRPLNGNIDAVAWPVPSSGTLLIESDSELADIDIYLIEVDE